MNTERFAQLIADSLGTEQVSADDRDLARALQESGHVHLTDDCVFDAMSEVPGKVRPEEPTEGSAEGNITDMSDNAAAALSDTRAYITLTLWANEHHPDTVTWKNSEVMSLLHDISARLTLSPPPVAASDTRTGGRA